MPNSNKNWFVTGSARGIGACLMKEALARGDNVVATARDRSSIAVPEDDSRERLLTVDLDVTDEAQAQAAVKAALERFGKIDVLVNNAGYGQLGLFEENTAEAATRQYATNVLDYFM